MRFDLPPRKPRGEAIIPMINVVFLLLVFFLLTAQIAPPEPFDLTPPDSMSDLPGADRDVLYVGADGALAYDGATGADIWSRIEARPRDEPLDIRADRQVEAARIGDLLARLGAIGIGDAQLIVKGR